MRLLVHFFQPLHTSMSIHLCRAQRGMSEQFLDRPEVGTGVEQMRGKAVS